MKPETRHRLEHRIEQIERDLRRKLRPPATVEQRHDFRVAAGEEGYAAAIDDGCRDFRLRLEERHLMLLLASDEELQAVSDAGDPGDAHAAMWSRLRRRWASGERPSAAQVWGLVRDRIDAKGSR